MADLRVDDLDAEILNITSGKMTEFNQKVAHVVKERDMYASIVERHLLRLAAEKGIDAAVHDFDLGTRSFVPKLKPLVLEETLPKTE